MAAKLLPVAAGELDRRVILQRKPAAQNAVGERVREWEDVAIVWASVQPIRGREYFSQGVSAMPVDIRVRIRYRPDLDQTWRLVFGGEPLEIATVIDVDAGRHTLELMCVRGVRDGRG